jgi:glycerol-3-phosphate O-acyltransferase / dihydroxyacetone phosphate acyltransferase
VSVAAPLGYRLVRRLAGALLGLFYRRVEIVGAERIPAAGPLVLAANHHNALVDPMLLLAAVPRRLRPLAKAPLFRSPLVGPLVRLTGALPVERRQDAGSDPARNEGMLRAATATLEGGGAILIFPEGLSQAEPRLMPLRSGAARLALGAARETATPVTLLPVGLVYHEPGSFRTGWALVLVGEPVPLAGGAPEAAVRETTERLATALRGLIVAAEDRKLLRLLHVAATIWEPETGPADPAARTTWMRAALGAYRYHLTRDPARLDALAHRVEGFAKDAAAVGWPRRAAPRLRYALREAASFLIGLPLAAAGLVVHVLPYQLTRLAVRRLHPDPDAEATYKLVAALVLYPVAWAIEAALAWRLGGPTGLGLFLVGLVPGGFFALSWWERLARVRREAGGFVRLLVRGDVHARLAVRRRALAAELMALAREVPETMLSGRSP